MTRLEIIHLRTAGRSSDDVIRRLCEAIAADLEGTEAVTIYRRCGLDTDVAVHITHHGSGASGGPSALGLHLAAGLSAYGLVEHTSWEDRT